MTRPERSLDPDRGVVEHFASDLRALRAAAGSPSYRQLAAKAHYSHTTLAAAAAGQRLPSLPVLLAYVAACGGDCQQWRDRWQGARVQCADWHGRDRLEDPGRYADAAWSSQPIADGSDPDAAGCGKDAVTVHARKVGAPESRLVLGQVQLRYSPRCRAAWSRFEGFSSLDHYAQHHQVEVEVAVVRTSDGVRLPFRCAYQFDYHWSDLLLPQHSRVLADTAVYQDGHQIAAARTNDVELP